MKIYYKSSKGLKEVNLYGMEEGKFQIGLNDKATILVTRNMLNFEDNISNKDALNLLQKGVTLTHKYFTDEEWIKMRLGIIYDENGFDLGCFNKFMADINNFDGACNEIVSYRHVNTGVIISVHDYNEEFVFSKKHKLWNPNGVDSGDIDGGRL